MKRLLLVSTISLLPASVYATKTTKTPITTKKPTTPSRYLITLENASEIQTRNSNITIKNINRHQQFRPIEAILVTPCTPKQQKETPTITISISPDQQTKKFTPNQQFLCVPQAK